MELPEMDSRDTGVKRGHWEVGEEVGSRVP